MACTGCQGGSLADAEPGAAYQVWPPDMDVRTPWSMNRLVALLHHELNELRFTPTDLAGLRARRERLAAAFRAAAPWDADEMWARLAFPRRNDALARAFHCRLATATRRFLLDILASRPRPQLEVEYEFEYEADDDPRAAHEAARRALRENLENLDRYCGGMPLKRLRKVPLNEGAEYLRLHKELDQALESKSPRRVRAARCAMTAFQWEVRQEPFSERKFDAYVEVTRAVKSAQWQVNRERSLLHDWYCEAWPLPTPMPARVRVGCVRQEKRVTAAEAALADLEARRTTLEDDILLGRWPKPA